MTLVLSSAGICSADISPEAVRLVSERISEAYFVSAI
jgi:hypothetical protein